MNKITIWETKNGNGVKALMGKDCRGFFEIRISDNESVFFNCIKKARKKFLTLANTPKHWL